MTVPQKEWKYGPRWHPSVLADVEFFIEHSPWNELNLKHLALYLGVSRQTIYNWCSYHPQFKLICQQVKHMAIMKMHMWGDEKKNAEHFEDL